MRPWVWVCVGVGIAATAGAVATRQTPSVSIGLSVIAVIAAMSLLVGLLIPERRRTPEPLARPRYPQSPLESALQSGDLGRERIIEVVETIQILTVPHPPRRLGPDEVRRLLRLDDAEFRQWVTTRLDALERMA